MLILKNALRKNALMSGLLARKMPNALLLFRIVKRNAEQKHHAGLFACPPKGVKPLSMWPNALRRMDAISRQFKRLWPLLTLNNASRKNALMNGLLARKMPNALLLFRIAKRNVEQKHHAGLFACPPKEVKPLSMWPNVLRRMAAISRQFKLMLL